MKTMNEGQQVANGRESPKCETIERNVTHCIHKNEMTNENKK